MEHSKIPAMAIAAMLLLTAFAAADNGTEENGTNNSIEATATITPSPPIAAAGSKCAFASDCPAGFLCLVPANATLASVDSMACIDPQASFERKYEVAYELSSNGSKVLVSRTIFVIPNLKIGATGGERQQKTSQVWLCAENQGPNPLYGARLSETLPANLTAMPAFKMAFYSPKPVDSRPAQGRASWLFYVERNARNCTYYSVNAGINKSDADAYAIPTFEEAGNSNGLFTGLQAGDVITAFAAGAVLALLFLLFGKAKSAASDAQTKPKIIKLKEKLWQHPSDWQRNANHLKKY